MNGKQTEIFGAVVDADFERFWVAYPRKVAKGDARRAWLKSRQQRPELAEILAAIERAKVSDQWRRGFVPYPATWLNQERWSDVHEIEVEPLPEKTKAADIPAGWWADDRKTEALARRLGLAARSGEDWHEFRARIRAELERRAA